MNRLPLSPAASGLLRTIVRRGRCDRDRILLTDLRSVEWQSLTFIGERHQLQIRVVGPDAGEIAERITSGIEDAELHVSGHVVADIRCTGSAERSSDGSVTLRIEALTVED